MSSLAALIQAVHERVPEMHRLTQSWVELDSFSSDLSGMNAMADALVSAFTLPELELRREPGGAGSGDHLFWSTPAAARAAPVLLIGHHDTVFPPGSFNPGALHRLCTGGQCARARPDRERGHGQRWH